MTSLIAANAVYRQQSRVVGLLVVGDANSLEAAELRERVALGLGGELVRHSAQKTISAFRKIR